MKIKQRIMWTAGLLYLVSQIFFLINSQFPKTHNFDEFHYVPSAKQSLELKDNRNFEHPPLGKLLMAGSIAIWGDRPIGWRFSSTLFGALSLVGMYFLALVLFRDEKIARWVAAITFFNQLLYVQSRIGMLDTFMFGFLIWALVAFCAAWQPERTKKQKFRLFLSSGILFGLSTACKWFSLFPWLACAFLVLGVRVLQIRHEGSRSSPKSKVKMPEIKKLGIQEKGLVQLDEKDWYHHTRWKDLSWKDWAICFGIAPVLAYFSTFIPFLFIQNASGEYYTILDFFRMQYRMWDGQLRVVSPHPYMSSWTGWPYMVRPIWYAFDREGPQWVRGVLLLGNPLIMWGGLLALCICAYDWIKTRNKITSFILFFYLVFYGCWIAIPRKIAFYYYYYPAGMMLSLALAYVLFEKKGRSDQGYCAFPYINQVRTLVLIVSAGLFIYFFPILAALKIPVNSFRTWMWFSSWI